MNIKVMKLLILSAGLASSVQAGDIEANNALLDGSLTISNAMEGTKVFLSAVTNCYIKTNLGVGMNFPTVPLDVVGIARADEFHLAYGGGFRTDYVTYGSATLGTTFTIGSWPNDNGSELKFTYNGDDITLWSILMENADAAAGDLVIATGDGLDVMRIYRTNYPVHAAKFAAIVATNNFAPLVTRTNTPNFNTWYTNVTGSFTLLQTVILQSGSTAGAGIAAEIEDSINAKTNEVGIGIPPNVGTWTNTLSAQINYGARWRLITNGGTGAAITLATKGTQRGD